MRQTTKSQHHYLLRAMLTQRLAPTNNHLVNLEGRSLYRLYQARRLEKPGPNGRPHKYSSDSIMMDMIVRLKGHAHQTVILA